MNDFLDRSSQPGRDQVIGIDLGGTNLRVVAFRGLAELARQRASGAELDDKAFAPQVEHREPVGEERAPEKIVERLAVLIEKVVREAHFEATVPVGIGFAGMLRGRDGLVVNSPHLRWRMVDFGKLLRARLGPERPAGIYNDVNAACYGEYAVGAAAGGSDVLTVLVGTGIGGGIVAGGRMLEGADNCAAEIGHVKVMFDQNARACACGLRGCVEAYVGGSNLMRRARAELAGGAYSAAVQLAGAPEHVHPGHLDAAAADGDEYALNLWAEVSPLLGVVLANTVTLLNPSHLVLGGGVMSRTPVLREHVIAAYEVAVNPPADELIALVDPALGDDAGAVGAALLAARAHAVH